MPQMSPMLWNYLSMIIFVLVSIMCLKIYFYMEQTKNKSLNEDNSIRKQESTKKMNWLW